MRKYYVVEIIDGSSQLVEIAKPEWLSLFGDDSIRDLCSLFYEGKIALEEIPEDARTAVKNTVSNRINRFGNYINQDVSESELAQAVEGIL